MLQGTTLSVKNLENDFEFTGYPGILRPKFESEEVGNKLALLRMRLKMHSFTWMILHFFALSQFKLDYPEYLEEKAYRFNGY